MAQFRASIQGQRGPASRLGNKKTGITAYVQGWNGGIRIEARHTDEDGDRFDLYATGGSSHTNSERLIGYVNDRGVFHSVGIDASAD